MLASQFRSGGRGTSAKAPFVFFYHLGDLLEIAVDEKTYGNDSRFCRRSSNFNAELRHVLDKGSLHLFIVAVKNVEKNQEILLPIDNALDSSLPSISADLREIKKQVGAEGDATVKIVAGMIILTLVISIVLGLWLGRSITRPIQVLTRTMTHLAGGDLDVVVEGTGRRDELGEMARALKVLQGVSQRQEVQTWAKDNLAALVADLQATSDSADFARALLSHLARSIPLFYGALYVTDPGGRSLARVGGYAVGYALEEKRFALGEGLIGQSAVDMQPLTICGVADGNPLIAIGLGGWKARALIILPVVVRGAATAVLELVPMEPLNQRQQILIEVLMPTLALNVEIMNAATRRRQGIEAPQVLAVG